MHRRRFGIDGTEISPADLDLRKIHFVVSDWVVQVPRLYAILPLTASQGSHDPYRVLLGRRRFVVFTASSPATLELDECRKRFKQGLRAILNPRD
jgi:hypothetical protein